MHFGGFANPESPQRLVLLFDRNVVSGAHYHFVSKSTSFTAYISAGLVMIIFVSDHFCFLKSAIVG